MKAAMWGVGLTVLGILGILLFNLFGNITVTNQFDYTTMKNAVQSAMLDSLDIAHYRAGFCLCTTDGSPISRDTVNTFNKVSEYKFLDVVDDKCGEENSNSCLILYGQYRLDKDKFNKLFEERFKNVKTNNKEYSLNVLDIIEYPPKVSVEVISSTDEYLPTDKESGGYDVQNKWHAIIETDNDLIAANPGDEEEKQYVCNPPTPIDDGNTNQNDSNNPGDSSNCKWHYSFTIVNCTGTSSTARCVKKSGSNYLKNQEKSALINANSVAKKECQCGGGSEVVDVNNFKFLQYYDVYDSTTKKKLCSKLEATNPSTAKSSCHPCDGKKCYVACTNQ